MTLARRLGAEVNENEAVKSWKVLKDRVEVETDRARYEAGSLVLAAGAWTGKLCEPLKALAVPERQVVGWFGAHEAAFAPENFPVFILDCPQHGDFYGIPEHEQAGYKIGKFHHLLQTVDADDIDRRIVPEDVAVLTGIGRYLAKPMGAPRTCKTCMFVNSPDEHFIVDRLPESRNVIVAAFFRPRLQVLRRHRRDPSRFGDRGAHAARHDIVSTIAARSRPTPACLAGKTASAGRLARCNSQRLAALSPAIHDDQGQRPTAAR